jgi:tetratricopeptide (TPR) repeat protein
LGALRLFGAVATLHHLLAPLASFCHRSGKNRMNEKTFNQLFQDFSQLGIKLQIGGLNIRDLSSLTALSKYNKSFRNLKKAVSNAFHALDEDIEVIDGWARHVSKIIDDGEPSKPTDQYVEVFNDQLDNILRFYEFEVTKEFLGSLYFHLFPQELEFAERLLLHRKPAEGRLEEIPDYAEIRAIDDLESDFSETKKSTPEVDSGRFSRLVDEGTDLFIDWKISDAIGRYLAAVHLNPYDAGVHVLLALAYWGLKDLGKAKQEALIAVAINPQHTSALEMLARLYLREGDVENAILMFQK